MYIFFEETKIVFLMGYPKLLMYFRPKIYIYIIILTIKASLIFKQTTILSHINTR